MTKHAKPNFSNSASQRQLDQAESQFNKFEEELKSLTMDRLNATPKEESEGPKISSKEIRDSKEIYLKPIRNLRPVDPKTGKSPAFNEKFRKDYEFAKELVRFIAQNKELDGENVEIWTLPFTGMEAEYWEVPTNKPVWGPRYLAEQIKRKFYHRLVMTRSNNVQDGFGQYYGTMAADTTIQRLDAVPATEKRSVFMGAANF